jgi:hypothetical protein
MNPNPPENLRFRGRDWAGVKWRLAQRYAQLTEEDLAYVPGEEEALLKRVTDRTMESRENLECVLRVECGCKEAASTPLLNTKERRSQGPDS